MDAPTTKWWQGWKEERQRATGVRVELRDENKLRDLLIRPEAAHVREHFYHPYRADQPPDEHRPDRPPPAVSGWAVPRWLEARPTAWPPPGITDSSE
jgi:hypothetical protein